MATLQILLSENEVCIAIAALLQQYSSIDFDAVHQEDLETHAMGESLEVARRLFASLPAESKSINPFTVEVLATVSPIVPVGIYKNKN